MASMSAVVVPGYCQEKQRLIQALAGAVTELLALQNQQLVGIVRQERNFSRFDERIRTALESKERLKAAYDNHVQDHGC